MSASEGRENIFETTLAVVIPTTLPRISFTAETIFAPFGETDSQPFTGGTSTQLGSYIRDNGLEAEFEVNLGIFSPEQTKGWLELHFDVVDKFSPGARPNALSIFTHKLNLELDPEVDEAKYELKADIYTIIFESLTAAIFNNSENFQCKINEN